MACDYGMRLWHAIMAWDRHGHLDQRWHGAFIWFAHLYCDTIDRSFGLGIGMGSCMVGLRIMAAACSLGKGLEMGQRRLPNA
jgi:hypothetical protein